MTRIVWRTRYPNRIMLKERINDQTEFRQDSFTHCVHNLKLFEGPKNSWGDASSLVRPAAATKQRTQEKSSHKNVRPAYPWEKNMSRVYLATYQGNLIHQALATN